MVVRRPGMGGGGVGGGDDSGIIVTGKRGLITFLGGRVSCEAQNTPAHAALPGLHDTRGSRDVPRRASLFCIMVKVSVII